MGKNIKALSVGAVLWDVIGDKEYIGGAPFNVAVNLKRLGAESAFITRIGNDERGAKTMQIMNDYGIQTAFVQKDKAFATGIARAVLDKNGNASYEIPRAAFDEISLTESDIVSISDYEPDVICFGSFEQRYSKSRESIQEILKKVNAKNVFFDVNVRMNFCDADVLAYSLCHTDILKLNEDESVLISNLLFNKTLSCRDFSSKIREKYGIRIVLITLGAKGCYVNTGSAEKIIPAETVDCADTIGAGDAFSGAFLYAYLSGRDPFVAASCGNILGAYVARNRGALPVLSPMIVNRLHNIIDSEE